MPKWISARNERSPLAASSNGTTVKEDTTNHSTNGKHSHPKVSIDAKKGEVVNAAVQRARQKILDRNLGPTVYIGRTDEETNQYRYSTKPDTVLFRTLRQTHERSIRHYLFFRWHGRAVKAAEKYFAKHMPYAPILSLNDLESTAAIGLLKAIDTFNPDRNDSFAAWMYRRIRWTIIDELRGMQDFPRIIASRRRTLRDKIMDLTHKLDHKPTLEDIRQHLGEDAYEMAGDPLFFANVFNQSLDSNKSKNKKTGAFTLAETVLDDSLELPCRILEGDIRRLVFAILGDSIELSVIYQYYFMRMAIPDIAVALGISTTSVSEKRQEALAKLKEGIENQ